VQVLAPSEQVAVARRCGWLNVTPLARRDVTHLHGLFFLLRLGRAEELRLARHLSHIAVSMPTQPHACWFDLHINGAPASINEDERFWPTALLFCSNRPPPDASWDPAGTLEFTLLLPGKWLRTRAAERIQGAFRGWMVRRRHVPAFTEDLDGRASYAEFKSLSLENGDRGEVDDESALFSNTSARRYDRLSARVQSTSDQTEGILRESTGGNGHALEHEAIEEHLKLENENNIDEEASAERHALAGEVNSLWLNPAAEF
jgi:hypothetical protein